MVKADGLIKEQLVQALKGSWGVFVNTNSEDSSIGDVGRPTETDLGKMIVDAAVEAKVEHFVYSGLASATKITNGAVSNLAFDEKDAIGEYAKSNNFRSVVIVSPGWYMENHLLATLAPIFGGFPYQSDEEGYLTLCWPRWGGEDEVPFVAIGEDYGDIVHGVFLNPDAYNGKFIQAVSHVATSSQFVQDFEKVSGKRSRYVPLEDWESFESHGDRGLETVKYMFASCQKSGGLYFGTKNDLTLAQTLKNEAVKAQGGTGQKLTTLKDFFAKHFAS